MKRILLLLTICLQFSYLTTKASTSTVVAVETGAGIKNGALLNVQDDKYDFMQKNVWDQVFANKASNARITLKYTGESKKIYDASWSVSVGYTVKSWGATGLRLPDFTGTLQIEYVYGAGAQYKDMDVFSIPGAYKTELHVNTVTAGAPLTGVPSDVILESSIETERYYFLSPSVTPIITQQYTTLDNTLELKWQFIQGAEEYDLEWVFITLSRDLAKQPIGTADFENATRITTTKNAYKLNLVFEDGYIYYRARAVGRKGSDFTLRQEGLWSSPSIFLYNQYGHSRNWQYQSNFAEEGKSKEVVTFFDGTGHNRQAVTKRNTENTILATETMYDFEGRPIIQTLPAPFNPGTSGLSNKRLDFYKKFSLNTNSEEFSRKDFDHDDFYSSVTCKPVAPNGMLASQGASNYYSPQNPDHDKGFNAALPDAQNFPYTQLVYDKEGKVKMTSGVGSSFKIGSNHEVKYLHSTVLQTQLDRLFGNDVGDASHYSQQATIDPNGQISISYLNLSGKVIATFLSGDKPANLEPLEDVEPELITDNFNALNTLSSTEEAVIIDTKFLVTSLVEHTFTYTISDETYASLCMGPGSEHHCVYDLLLTIYDECDQPVADANGVLQQLFVITGPTTKEFNVNFPRIGNYRIRKKLTLNQQALASAVADFKANLPGNCISSLEEIIQEYTQATDMSECLPTACELDCQQAATNSGKTPGTQAWLDEVASCKLANCSGQPKSNCESFKKQLIADMSPKGQYFDNTAKTTGINEWLYGNIWYDCDTRAWDKANFRDKNNNVIYTWSDLRTNWKDEFATKAFDGPNTNPTTNCPLTYTPAVIGDSGTPEEKTISHKFSLAAFHPEYCTYEWCIKTEPSTAFDTKLNIYNSYSWASTTPSVAPYIVTTQSPIGKNLLDADPYFNGTGEGISQKSIMSGYLTDLDVNNVDLAGIWDQAGTYAQCTNCDDQWQIFRALYQAKKGELMLDRKNQTSCHYLCDMSATPNYCDDQATDAGGFEVRWPYHNFKEIRTKNDYDIFASHLYIYMPNCDPPRLNSEEIEIATDHCVDVRSCVCDELDNYKTLYNAKDPVTNVLYVDHGAYTLEEYVAQNLILQYNLTGGDASTATTLAGQWLANCEYNRTHPYNTATGDKAESPEQLSIDGEPLSTTVPLAINCDDKPDDCDEDATTIAIYYANEEYEKLVEAATEDYIQAYKRKCLHTGMETYEVKAEKLSDYQYTLYYFDRAGNLMKTIPPEGVKILNASQIDQVDRFRHGEFGVAAVYPAHQLVTKYKYNSFNELIIQNTPDAGQSTFWYNDAGQLRYSMNEKQTAQTIPDYDHGPFSYTKYDAQGRVIEVGESQEDPLVFVQGPLPGQGHYVAGSLYDKVNDPNFPASLRTEVTKTYYDTYASVAIQNKFPGQQQKNLRSRVSTVSYEDVGDNNDDTYNHATHYNYDPEGYVNILLQDNPDLKELGQDVKKIEYDYDLISGNVNRVSYQRDQPDQFYHRYTYDEDNRITSALTSNNGVIWSNDAKYYYYLHGPLARVELGDKKVQGLDYAYTLQGWLKAVNGSTIESKDDIGKDGEAGNKYDPLQNDLHKNVARDVFAYSLGYFNGDYVAIDNDANHQFLGNINNPLISVEGDDLFNGDIKMKTSGLMKINDLGSIGGPPIKLPVAIVNYSYDQLNRIKNATYQFDADNQFSNVQQTTEYRSSFKYDRNGNITKQLRNGSAITGIDMDDLSYQYDYINGDKLQGLNSNRLLHVNDAVPASADYSDDIEDQDKDNLHPYNHADPSTWNYRYDEIGNLTGDKKEGIASIDWSVYGKIKRINRIPGFKRNLGEPKETEPADLEFAYDASGNRVMKKIKSRRDGDLRDEDSWNTTYYVRDAQGNVMATYERYFTRDGFNSFTDHFNLMERPLYGSGRLGMSIDQVPEVTAELTATMVNHRLTNKLYSAIPPPAECMLAVCPQSYNNRLGMKRYELNDHLGNVQTVVTDLITGVDEGTDHIADYFKPDLLTVTDYYPFGSTIQDRSSGASGYRYGFNGKENDDEVKGGQGNSQDYGMRMYDSRIGRWLSLDPLQRKYPDKSAYSSTSNNPVNRIDVDGNDDFHFYTYTCNTVIAGRCNTSTVSWFTVTVTDTKNTYTVHNIQKNSVINKYTSSEGKAYETTKRVTGVEAGNAILEFGLNELPDYAIIYYSGPDASFKPTTYTDAGDIQNLASLANRKNFENKVHSTMLGLVAIAVSEGLLLEYGGALAARFGVGRSAAIRESFIADSPIELTTSSESMAPSRTYTIYDGSGQLYKFGVTDADLVRFEQSRLEAGPGATGKYSEIMPKYQAHKMEKYLRSLQYNSTGQYVLPGMRIPYPVDFNTGLPIKPLKP
jgi:RHS repeat-associated protein